MGVSKNWGLAFFLAMFFRETDDQPTDNPMITTINHP
jgi:hypothetical protein